MGNKNLPADLRSKFNAASVPLDTSRWTPAKKEIVVLALNSGKLSFDDLRAAYPDISREEVETWQAYMKKGGRPSLRTTRLQMHRGRGNEARPSQV